MVILCWLHKVYGSALIEGIRAALPDEEVREWPDVGDPAAIDVCMIHRKPAGFLKPFANLKMVSSTGAGIDNYLLDRDDLRPGVRLVRVVDGDFAARMADYVLAWTLFHHRDIARFLAAQRERRWSYRLMRSAREVRVGVMGLGQMGRLSAERLAAVGYATAAWSRTPRSVPGIECHAGPDGLGPFLARTEILVNLLPLTDETRGILCAATFAQMPRGGVVISAGRGGHLVVDDVIRALDEGQLRAATVDAFPVEPLPQDSPLWDREDFFVTPHSSSTASLETIVGAFAENVRRLRAGLPLRNEVDTAAGY